MNPAEHLLSLVAHGHDLMARERSLLLRGEFDNDKTVWVDPAEKEEDGLAFHAKKPAERKPVEPVEAAAD